MAKWGKCDYRQFKKFQERIEKLSKDESNLFYQECGRELAARLLALVIPRTPVGKNAYVITSKNKKESKKEVIRNGGTLRRGWTAKTQEEAENGGNMSAKEYAYSLNVVKIGDTYQIEVINPVEYSSYVEHGHRQEPGRFVPALGKRLKAAWVDGVFMLTISEKELESIAPKILERKLTKYLEECFDGK